MDANVEAKMSHEELVVAYTDFGRKIAWGYSERYEQAAYGDLEAAAIRGLWKAARKFDPAKGRFTTIADYWVKAEIRQALRQDRPIAGLRTAKDEEGEQTNMVDVLEDRNATDPAEATKLGLIAERVREAMAQALTAKEAELVAAVFGLNEAEVCIATAAEKMGLSRQRGAQIYDNAMAKLRRIMAA